MEFKKIVHKFKSEWKYKDLKRVGKPPKLSKRSHSIIRRLYLKNRRLSLRNIACIYNMGSTQHVSRCTVNRILNKYGLYWVARANQHRWNRKISCKKHISCHSWTNMNIHETKVFENNFGHTLTAYQCKKNKNVKILSSYHRKVNVMDNPKKNLKVFSFTIQPNLEWTV